MKALLEVFHLLRVEYGAMLRLVLLLTVPAAVIYVYMHLHVELAILNRRVHLAEIRKAEIVKRNDALQNAIDDLSGRETLSGSLPVLEKNKIVRIQLPPSLDALRND